MPKVSVIVPAYNEGMAIKKNLEYLSRTLHSEPLLRNFEIIVVDDGSTDNTREEAKKFGKAKVVGYENNRGKGAALIYGLVFAKGDYILFIDADMEIDPRQAKKLMEVMLAKNADVVIFSKNVRGARINFPLHRKVLSRGYYFIVHLLFNIPVNDTQVGCKMFRVAALKKVADKIKTEKFAFDLEMLYLLNTAGYRIIEVPVEISFRREKLRISMRNILRMLSDTLGIFHRHRIKKYFKKG
jgi:glycosyltransferase involved in cell wall biosynthesis